MEVKDKETLSQISTDMWVKFSDSAEYRKKLDGEYSDLLKIKNRLKKIDCKTANDFKLISDLISSIDNFYDIGTFATYDPVLLNGRLSTIAFSANAAMY